MSSRPRRTAEFSVGSRSYGGFGCQNQSLCDRRDLADRIVGRRPRARRFAVGDRCAARADAFTYWNLIGLSVKPDRLTQVHVDGGGEISADAGTGETCLDVEQSGGLAPGAKVIVYDAPNSDAGFIDLFYKAASDSLVDTMSCSWGEAEELFFPEVAGVDSRPQLIAFHQAFLEAAAQGIAVFAVSGDNGACVYAFSWALCASRS